MTTPEVLFRLGALPLQQLLLLGSKMAHLPLLGALVSGAQGFGCDAASGWLAKRWLTQTDGDDCRRPKKDKALTAHKEPPASNAAPRHHSGRPNIAALDLLPMLMRSPLVRDRRKPPDFIRPALPVLATAVPVGDGWRTN